MMGSGLHRKPVPPFLDDLYVLGQRGAVPSGGHAVLVVLHGLAEAVGQGPLLGGCFLDGVKSGGPW